MTKHQLKRMLGITLPIAGAAFLTSELYRYIFCRSSSPLFCALLDSDKGHDADYYAFRQKAAAQLHQTPHETYTIYSARGEALKGFYYPCGAHGKRIAFILHGYRSNHEDTAGMVYDYYRSRGIDVFCCDHTAAGESGGQFIGFDVLETPDCLAWLQFLQEKFGQDVQIILHGFSMGAATVLQMSSHCPKNVKFIISDSAYQNARAVMERQIGPLYIPMRKINQLAAGYDWNDTDVTHSLAQASVPILFVHGQDDQLVPFENGTALYHFYPGEKDCFFPLATKHIESLYTCPTEYQAKIDTFLEKYMGS